jgi:hypothetical protein
MNMPIKFKNLMIIVFSLVSILFLIPYQTNAFRANHPPEDISVVCNRFCEDTNRTLQTTGVAGNLRFEVKSKEFQMVRSDTGKNLNLSQSNSSLPLGTTLQFRTFNNRISNATGRWYFIGGAKDSPEMDDNWYSYIVDVISQGRIIGERLVRFKADYPNNNDPISIEGSGAVRCNNNICNAIRVGDASITITFPADQAKFQSQRFFNNGFIEDDDVSMRYKKATFTYTFEVYDDNNTPHTVACLDPDNITATSARIRWRYNDVDIDPQTLARVELATDSEFNNIVKQAGIAGTSNNLTVDGLNLNTRYFVRVRAKNEVNRWSDWQNCASPFRTLNNRDPRVEYRATTNITETSAIANWIYSDLDPDPQIRATVELATDQKFENVVRSVSVTSDKARSLNINGLVPNTIYYPKVRVENGPNGWSEWKTGARFTTGVGINNPPTFNYDRTDDITETSAIAYWKYFDPDPDPQTEANIELSEYENFDIITHRFNVNGDVQSVIMPGLKSGTTYYPRVQGRNANSDWSEWKTGAPFTTEFPEGDPDMVTGGGGIIPTIPPDISITCSIDGAIDNTKTVSSNNSTVTFNITVKVEGIDDYKLFFSKNGSGDRKDIGEGAGSRQITSDYKDEKFGKYTPTLSIEYRDGLPTSTSTSCGTVNNLGTSTIREVR